MEKMLTLTEVMALVGKNVKVFETETAFLVNMFGKYNPNITFVVDKVFAIGKNSKPLSPISYMSDKSMTDNMNIDFDGSAEFMYGDYWVSKKGGACFRPKSPLEAKHLLIRVDWGGCFDHHRGCYEEEAYASGAIYFRRASSNGGGAGYDYWVLPVGYTYRMRDEEVDCGRQAKYVANDASQYRKKHAEEIRSKIEEADVYLKEKAAREEASKAVRGKYIERLEEIKAEFDRLRAIQQPSGEKYYFPDLTFGEVTFYLDSEHYYGEEGLEYAQKALANKIKYIEQREAEAVIRAEEAKELERKRQQEEAERLAAKKAQEELEAAQAQAKAMGLPSDVKIWKRLGGATNAGKGFVITPNGMDRDSDTIEGDRRRIERYGEGWEVWHQIMPGELVLSWAHAFTAAEHEFEVIYRPDTITEAQLERVAEIQIQIEEEWFGKAGLTGTRTCPSIGKGWELF